MLTSELQRALRDGPLRAAIALWAITVAGFTVNVYPLASSYAGVGEGFELFGGLQTALLVSGAACVPWIASRLLWIERAGKATPHAGDDHAGGALAKAAATHSLVLLLVLLAMPFVIVAYRTSTVAAGAAVLAIASTTLFLCLLGTLTLHCTMHSRHFLLSVAAAYAAMIAAVAGLAALGRWGGAGGAVVIVAALNAISVYGLTRRSGPGPLPVPS